MTFEWDPRKSAENLDRRGFDFAFATLVFDGTTARRIISTRVSSRAERRHHAQEIAAHHAEPRKG